MVRTMGPNVFKCWYRTPLKTSLDMALSVNFTTLLYGVCWSLAFGGFSEAQVNDLRYSRQSLPGVSTLSEIGLMVNVGQAENFISSRRIIEIVQSRMEILGYRVALGFSHSSDGLWLHVDCRGLPNKIRASSPQTFPSSSNSTSLRLHLVS